MSVQPGQFGESARRGRLTFQELRPSFLPLSGTTNGAGFVTAAKHMFVRYAWDVKVAEWAKRQGISSTTAWRWTKELVTPLV
jgi:hypothetical protein